MNLNVTASVALIVIAGCAATYTVAGIASSHASRPPVPVPAATKTVTRVVTRTVIKKVTVRVPAPAVTVTQYAGVTSKCAAEIYYDWDNTVPVGGLNYDAPACTMTDTEAITAASVSG